VTRQTDGKEKAVPFEVNRSGRAIIRAEHNVSRTEARNVLANYASKHGASDLLQTEVEAAIRETLCLMGKDAYTPPVDMFQEDWLWVDRNLRKVWKDPK
jgi:hypothetical protein